MAWLISCIGSSIGEGRVVCVPQPRRTCAAKSARLHTTGPGEACTARDGNRGRGRRPFRSDRPFHLSHAASALSALYARRSRPLRPVSCDPERCSLGLRGRAGPCSRRLCWPSRSRPVVRQAGASQGRDGVYHVQARRAQLAHQLLLAPHAVMVLAQQQADDRGLRRGLSRFLRRLFFAFAKMLESIRCPCMGRLTPFRATAPAFTARGATGVYR